jgi:hypothetical protein
VAWQPLPYGAIRPLLTAPSAAWRRHSGVGVGGGERTGPPEGTIMSTPHTYRTPTAPTAPAGGRIHSSSRGRRVPRPWLLALAVAALASGTWASQIIELHSDTLTSYLPTGNTAVQGIRPLHLQRGVNIDGSLRHPPSLAVALAGNPFGESFDSNNRLGDLRLDIGTYAPTEVDLALPAPGFRWVIGRSYNGRQQTSGAAHQDSNGYQGRNWFQSCQWALVYFTGGTADKDVIYMVYGADRFIECHRTGSTSSEYKAVNGAAGVIQFAPSSGSEPETYTYYDQVGNQVVFFGSTNGGVAKFQIWKMIDPAGNTAYVGDATTGSTAITNGYDSGGRILKAYDTADRRYTSTFTTLDSVVRLTQVKAETKTGGTWASPTGVAEVGRVDYAYYQTGDNTWGDNGTLKLVTVTTPLSPASTNLVTEEYFRYWTGTYNASTNPGYPYTIKEVVGTEGARNYDWSDSTFNDSFNGGGVTVAALKPYSRAYLEYDSSYRVNSAFFNGDCGCAGANNGTYTFTYDANGSYTDNSGYDTAWASRTVAALPDGSYRTAYFDEAGQPVATVVTDIIPTSTSPTPKKWVTRAVRDATSGSSPGGQVTELDTPASVSGYTHNTSGNPDGTITVSSTTGLIWTYTRAGSGDLLGFLNTVKFKEAGTGGSAYYMTDLTYASTPPQYTVGTVVITRPVVTDRKDYATKSTSTSSDPLEVQTTITTYSSGSAALAAR